MPAPDAQRAGFCEVCALPLEAPTYPWCESGQHPLLAPAMQYNAERKVSGYCMGCHQPPSRCDCLKQANRMSEDRLRDYAKRILEHVVVSYHPNNVWFTNVTPILRELADEAGNG